MIRASKCIDDTGLSLHAEVLQLIHRSLVQAGADPDEVEKGLNGEGFGDLWRAVYREQVGEPVPTHVNLATSDELRRFRNELREHVNRGEQKDPTDARGAGGGT